MLQDLFASGMGTDAALGTSASGAGAFIFIKLRSITKLLGEISASIHNLDDRIDETNKKIVTNASGINSNLTSIQQIRGSMENASNRERGLEARIKDVEVGHAELRTTLKSLATKSDMERGFGQLRAPIMALQEMSRRNGGRGNGGE